MASDTAILHTSSQPTPPPLTDAPARAAIGVVGAGAMGTGIAHVALRAGHPVVIADARPDAAARAATVLGGALERDVLKGRVTRATADAALAGLVTTSADAIGAFGQCGLVIEAVVEQLDVKRALFVALEREIDDASVLASNTSSLSITALAGACRRPERVLGVHFFNPAPVLPLVELVPGIATDPSVVDTVDALVSSWGKTTVRAADTPGFIVNRVARPFYGEALRILDEGLADPATIDRALCEHGGFRMGPFELMDLIGHDVNFAVTRSVYEQTFQDPRYRPSLTQQRLVEAGRLGRKSGRGFYEHGDGIVRPEPTRDPAAADAIVRRVVAMLVNEACDAVHWGIASAADVERAMTTGVNYPRGLLAWGDLLGPAVVAHEIDQLREQYQEDRYRVSPLLRRVARTGGRLAP